jgi:hypothetical protein
MKRRQANERDEKDDRFTPALAREIGPPWHKCQLHRAATFRTEPLRLHADDVRAPLSERSRWVGVGDVKHVVATAFSWA